MVIIEITKTVANFNTVALFIRITFLLSALHSPVYVYTVIYFGCEKLLY